MRRTLGCPPRYNVWHSQFVRGHHTAGGQNGPGGWSGPARLSCRRHVRRVQTYHRVRHKQRLNVFLEIYSNTLNQNINFNAMFKYQQTQLSITSLVNKDITFILHCKRCLARLEEQHGCLFRF